MDKKGRGTEVETRTSILAINALIGNEEQTGTKKQGAGLQPIHP